MANSQQSPNAETIIAALMEKAESGDAKAQYGLGMLYAHGEGVDLNYSEAARWLEQAALQNVAEAQRVLAWMYATGYGKEQDDAQALHWHLTAAENGDAGAQLAAATIYQFGRFGAEANAGEMLKWYEKAANQGEAKAQFALGKLMAVGELVQQNDEAAFQWLTLAILSGSEPAKKELAMLTSRLNEDQIAGFRQRMLQAMEGGKHG